MSIENIDDAIILKESLTPKDCAEIQKLEEICFLHDKINLKTELDFKLTLPKKSINIIDNINEFLYYHKGELVSYLGICNFGGHVYELNGMTHPDWRRKGYFKKLFNLAIWECKEKNKKTILLLADGKSDSGISFIESVGGSYHFSEYRMKQIPASIPSDSPNMNSRIQPSITLISAVKSDLSEIIRQNAEHFNTTVESEASLIDESMLHEGIFMILLNDQIIGKINVDFNEDSAFIYGFGVKSEFRGKGYGRAALQQTVSIIHDRNISNIELDVETKNDRALHLYKDCGFEEQSVMKYYDFNL